MTLTAADRRREEARAAGFPKPVAEVIAVCVGALLVQVAVHAMHFLARATAFIVGDPGAPVTETLTALEAPYRASFFVFGVAVAIGAAAWFRWLSRAIMNLTADGIYAFRRSKGQVVGAYFLPGANLFQPLQDLRQLYRVLRAGNAWRTVEPLPWITVWWALTMVYLLLVVLNRIAGISEWSVIESALGVLISLLALTVLRCFSEIHPHWRDARATGHTTSSPLGQKESAA